MRCTFRPNLINILAIARLDGALRTAPHFMRIERLMARDTGKIMNCRQVSIDTLDLTFIFRNLLSVNKYLYNIVD